MKKFSIAVGKALLYFLAFFGIQIVSSALFSFIIGFQTALETESDVSQNELTNAITSKILENQTAIILTANILLLLVLFLFFKIRKKNFCSEIQLQKCGIGSIIAGVLFGMGLSTLVSFVINLIPFSDEMVGSFNESYSLIGTGNIIITYLSVALVAPIAEEILFRGLIFTRLKKGMHFSVAIIISSLLFALAHGDLIWMIPTFFLGASSAWIFEKTKSLLPSIALHLFNNILAVLTISITQMPVWISLMILLLSPLAVIISAVYLIKYQKTVQGNDVNENAPVQ